MAKSQDQTASFMMLCIRDFANKLWIPTKFVRKYSEITEQRSVMLQTDSEKRWDVKIKRMYGDFYMTDGWSEFVKDNELTAFDFLTFRLLRGSTEFKVSVYGAHGCPKRPASSSSTDDEDEDEMLHENKARDENVRKMRVFGSKRRPRGRPPKIVLHGTHVRMNRRQSKACNDDVVSVGSSNRQNSNPLYMEICLSHHQRSRISLPVRFFRAGGLMDRKYVKMEFVASGYCKPVALDHLKISRMDLATGWSEFRKANNIGFGKTYSFEYNPELNVIRVKEVKKLS